MNRFAERLLEQPWVYKTWQGPFADQKFAPVLAHNDLRQARRVLDVGCGTGTNAKYFAETKYLGIDINPEYIDDARRNCQGEFVTADVRTYSPPGDLLFDFVLVNSFLHHLNSTDVEGVLRQLRKVLAVDGHAHILELVLPQDLSIPRLLARCDRGRFPRPESEWEMIFSQVFEPVVFETYPLTGAGLSLWSMVYFKGRARR